MPTRHVLQPGECTISLAGAQCSSAWKRVWDHADNEALRKRCISPFTLVPGEVITVPDPQVKKLAYATGARHEIVVKRVWARVRIHLLQRGHDGIDKPIGDVGCKLVVDDVTTNVTSDGDGWIDLKVSPRIGEAVLTVDGADDRPPLGWRLSLGALLPVAESQGAADRLANLGYGATGEDPVACLPFALRAFQEEANLKVTGALDEATATELTKRHGI